MTSAVVRPLSFVIVCVSLSFDSSDRVEIFEVLSVSSKKVTFSYDDLYNWISSKLA